MALALLGSLLGFPSELFLKPGVFFLEIHDSEQKLVLFVVLECQVLLMNFLQYEPQFFFRDLD